MSDQREMLEKNNLMSFRMAFLLLPIGTFLEKFKLSFKKNTNYQEVMKSYAEICKIFEIFPERDWDSYLKEIFGVNLQKEEEKKWS